MKVRIILFILALIVPPLAFSLGEYRGIRSVEKHYQEIGCYLRDGVLTISDERAEDIVISGMNLIVRREVALEDSLRPDSKGGGNGG